MSKIENDKATLGQMIKFFIQENGSIEAGHTEEDIKNFWKKYHKEETKELKKIKSKKFKHYVYDSKESIYYVFKEELGFSDKQIEAESLVYAFYEVEFDCVYEDGEVYITHCNGVKLEEKAMA